MSSEDEADGCRGQGIAGAPRLGVQGIRARKCGHEPVALKQLPALPDWTTSDNRKNDHALEL